MRTLLFLLCFILAALPGAAQRDFLTTDEADQVRLAQEPNARLMLYADFARQRVDLLEHLLAKDEPGRSSMIHETLQDYTKIVETMDVVADDALTRDVDIAEGIAAVVKAEEDFIERLGKVRKSEPKDFVRYRFVFDMAYDTTEDSLDINREDLAGRKMDVVGREEAQQREVEELMTPEMRRGRAEDTAALEEKDKEEEKKAPSLFRKDEKKEK